MCLFYTASSRVPDPIRRPVRHLISRAPDADVAVAHGNLYDVYGPELIAVDRAAPDHSYHPRWTDLARILGSPMPYWPMALRKPEEMVRWKPGDPVQLIDATHELDTTPLLRLAADSEDNTPEAMAALHLARTVHEGATSDALGDIEILDTRTTARQSGLLPPPSGPASRQRACPRT